MTTYGFLLLFSCSILLNGQDAFRLRPACELRARVEVEKSAANILESRATIIVDGKVGTFKYLFFDEKSGRMLQRDFSKNSLEGLKKGTYYCVVVEDGGCTAKVHFEIQ